MIPPAVTATDPQSGFGALVDHLTAAATFTVPLLLDAVAGGDSAYDGTFYRDRSPSRVINRVNVPTFLIGGEFDLFQRGTPLLFENLQKRGVPTKMIIGPWDHLEGSSGADVGKAGHGTLSELQLRWFDRYVRGVKDPTLDKDIPPVTYYEQGSGRWTKAKRWIGDQHAESFRLSGAATAGGGHGVLTRGKADGRHGVRPAGAGLRPLHPLGQPVDRRAPGGGARRPAVLPGQRGQRPDRHRLRDGAADERRRGCAARSTRGSTRPASSGDGMLSVSVSDVAPDGKVSRLTGGWQVVSQRALDKARTPLPRRQGAAALPPLHQGVEEAARQRRGRAGRRRGLPDRGADREGPPAADRDPGLRRAAPAADASPTCRAR